MNVTRLDPNLHKRGRDVRQTPMTAKTTMICANENHLFTALDGCRLSARARYWNVEIYGVFEHEGKFWVQLLLRGAPDYHVTVQIDQDQQADTMADLLARWLANPARQDVRIRYSG